MIDVRGAGGLAQVGVEEMVVAATVVHEEAFVVAWGAEGAVAQLKRGEHIGGRARVGEAQRPRPAALETAHVEVLIYFPIISGWNFIRVWHKNWKSEIQPDRQLCGWKTEFG